MNKILKTGLMVCMLSMLLGSTCFAFEKVQMNDTLGAGAINSAYNDFFTGTQCESLKTDNFRHMGPRDEYEIYFSTVSGNNAIEYICNKAGYVDAIAITSPSAKTNSLEAYALLVIVSNKYNLKAADASAYESTSKFTSCNWYCKGTNRTYHVDTTHYDKYVSTIIYAFVN